jgi:hypothetical protein
MESNKTKCTVQEAAERHLCRSDLYGFRQENNMRIYVHPHPQGSTYRVTVTKLRQKFEKQKEIRDIKIEGKKLSDMSDKI